MTTLKKISLILLLVFIVIQFIRPAKNDQSALTPADITVTMPVPDSVMAILKVACYDCHSNNTRYPWYVNIQPVGWWLTNHIKDGKRHLNFSEFNLLTTRRKLSKLKEIISMVRDDAMPLSSYTWIHKDARLNGNEKRLINEWAQRSLIIAVAK